MDALGGRFTCGSTGGAAVTMTVVATRLLLMTWLPSKEDNNCDSRITLVACVLQNGSAAFLLHAPSSFNIHHVAWCSTARHLEWRDWGVPAFCYLPILCTLLSVKVSDGVRDFTAALILLWRQYQKCSIGEPYLCEWISRLCGVGARWSDGVPSVITKQSLSSTK